MADRQDLCIKKREIDINRSRGVLVLRIADATQLRFDPGTTSVQSTSAESSVSSSTAAFKKFPPALPSTCSCRQTEADSHTRDTASNVSQLGEQARGRPPADAVPASMLDPSDR